MKCTVSNIFQKYIKMQYLQQQKIEFTLHKQIAKEKYNLSVIKKEKYTI